MGAEYLGDTKLCPGCGKDKALTDFHRDRTHSDGYKSNCKECRSGRPAEPVQQSAARKGLEGKTEQELETIARSMAIRRVIENHKAEFDGLISRYRGEVGIKRGWVGLK